MPIERLPQSTIHTVASSQVLTDSRSVVKELVDNSLDAQASAIFIEISPNAVDLIQVKDNGHGISPDDRGMVGRKHCTSKIRNLNDLEVIGGISLGFRGEALASAAELCGSMVVTTRIEGEVTAVSLTISRKGEIEKEERTSQAVGTTVRIIDFLKTIPVRRQTVIKASTKHLAGIKTLLQAYALARPSVRFGMKIIKAKDHKSNWTYAPKNGDGIPDAVIKVAGSKVAQHCHWKTWPTALPVSPEATILDNNTNAEANERYYIEAFLPVSECDPKIVNNLGQFVTIDSRPISCNRGTPKQIITLYKSYLSSGALAENQDTYRDPFLCMNIICPSGSYDVNIEPAKDNVLFTNADSVIKALEAFFRNVYGDLSVRTLDRNKSKSTDLKPRGFDLLLAKKPPLIPAPELGLSSAKSDLSGPGSTTQRNEPSVNGSRPTRNVFGHLSEEHLSNAGEVANLRDAIDCDSALESTMSTSQPVDINNQDAYGQQISKSIRRWDLNKMVDSSEDVDFPLDLQNCDSPSELSPASEREEDTNNPKISNPWVFAKMNAPIHNQINRRESYADVESNDQLLTPPRHQVGDIRENTAREVCEMLSASKKLCSYLPTPQQRETYHAATKVSRRSPGSSNQKVWRKADHGGVSEKRGGPEDSNYGFGNLDTWVKLPSSLSSQTSREAQNSEPFLHDNELDFKSASSLGVDIPLGFRTNVDKGGPRKPFLLKQQKGYLNKPFAPLVNNSIRSQSEKVPWGKNLGPQLGETQPSCVSSIDDHESMTISESSNTITSIHPDLAMTMDYELRKQQAMQKWKASKLQREANESKSNALFSDTTCTEVASPYKNRYDKAIAALHAVETDKRSPSTPLIDPGDPRAYLIRTQEREATAAPGESPSRLRKRTKTSRLPLESLREDSIVRDLTLCLKSEDLDLKTRIAALSAEGTCNDRYIATGNLQAGFSSPAPSIQCIRSWEANLRGLIRKLYAKDDDDDQSGGVDMRIDLWPVLQLHLAAADP